MCKLYHVVVTIIINIFFFCYTRLDKSIDKYTRDNTYIKHNTKKLKKKNLCKKMLIERFSLKSKIAPEWLNHDLLKD